ncbi:MAG TPA: T9SS type A sorting domain-containing protein, partial [Bacteroidales bacterium]|nr:T9SS type A sorting domain-containing protein [Bacteroidales bacterium]
VMQIRPNPFSVSSNIDFSIPGETRVKISVYDAKGNELQVLKYQTFAAGKHSFTWSISDASGNTLTPGKYFVKFDSGSYTEVKKVIVLEK